MAFNDKLIDVNKIIYLILFGLPVIAPTNIDCNGKPFHCVNSTHFMICVDLGGGTSKTIDNFVIPCPSTTECKGTNHFECEYVPRTTTVSPVQSSSVKNDIIQDVIPQDWEKIDLTTTKPGHKTSELELSEKYFNGLSITTLPVDIATSNVNTQENGITTEGFNTNNGVASTTSSYEHYTISVRPTIDVLLTKQQTEVNTLYLDTNDTASPGESVPIIPKINDQPDGELVQPTTPRTVVLEAEIIGTDTNAAEATTERFNYSSTEITLQMSETDGYKTSSPLLDVTTDMTTESTYFEVFIPDTPHHEENTNIVEIDAVAVGTEKYLTLDNVIRTDLEGTTTEAILSGPNTPDNVLDFTNQYNDTNVKYSQHIVFDATTTPYYVESIIEMSTDISNQENMMKKNATNQQLENTISGFVTKSTVLKEDYNTENTKGLAVDNYYNPSTPIIGFSENTGEDTFKTSTDSNIQEPKSFSAEVANNSSFHVPYLAEKQYDSNTQSYNTNMYLKNKTLEIINSGSDITINDNSIKDLNFYEITHTEVMINNQKIPTLNTTPMGTTNEMQSLKNQTYNIQDGSLIEPVGETQNSDMYIILNNKSTVLFENKTAFAQQESNNVNDTKRFTTIKAGDNIKLAENIANTTVYKYLFADNIKIVVEEKYERELTNETTHDSINSAINVKSKEFVNSTAQSSNNTNSALSTTIKDNDLYDKNIEEKTETPSTLSDVTLQISPLWDLIVNAQPTESSRNIKKKYIENTQTNSEGVSSDTTSNDISILPNQLSPSDEKRSLLSKHFEISSTDYFIITNAENQNIMNSNMNNVASQNVSTHLEEVLPEVGIANQPIMQNNQSTTNSQVFLSPSGTTSSMLALLNVSKPLTISTTNSDFVPFLMEGLVINQQNSLNQSIDPLSFLDPNVASDLPDILGLIPDQEIGKNVFNQAAGPIAIQQDARPVSHQQSNSYPSVILSKVLNHLATYNSSTSPVLNQQAYTKPSVTASPVSYKHADSNPPVSVSSISNQQADSNTSVIERPVYNQQVDSVPSIIARPVLNQHANLNPLLSVSSVLNQQVDSNLSVITRPVSPHQDEFNLPGQTSNQLAEFDESLSPTSANPVLIQQSDSNNPIIAGPVSTQQADSNRSAIVSQISYQRDDFISSVVARPVFLQQEKSILPRPTSKPESALDESNPFVVAMPILTQPNDPHTSAIATPVSTQQNDSYLLKPFSNQNANYNLTIIAIPASNLWADLNHTAFASPVPNQQADSETSVMSSPDSTQLADLSPSVITSPIPNQQADSKTSVISSLDSTRPADLSPLVITSPIPNQQADSKTSVISSLDSTRLADLSPLVITSPIPNQQADSKTSVISSLDSTRPADLSPLVITSPIPNQQAVSKTSVMSSLDSTRPADLSPSVMSSPDSTQPAHLSPSVITSPIPNQKADSYPSVTAGPVLNQQAVSNPTVIASPVLNQHADSNPSVTTSSISTLTIDLAQVANSNLSVNASPVLNQYTNLNHSVIASSVSNQQLDSSPSVAASPISNQHANLKHSLVPSLVSNQQANPIPSVFLSSALDHLATSKPSMSPVLNQHTDSYPSFTTTSIISKPQITSNPAFTSPILASTDKTQQEESFNCFNKYRGRYADNRDCRKFYVCVGLSVPITGICPVNTVFSELRKQCTKNLSHCIRENEFKCVSEGRFGDVLKNNVYYICVKKLDATYVRFKLQCQLGYHLNTTSVKCVENVVPQLSISSISASIDSSSTIDSEIVSGPEKKSNKNQSKTDKIGFECESEGKFTHPSNCRKYYVCTKKNSEFRRKSKKCDSDEVFHKEKKKCVDADSYEC